MHEYSALEEMNASFSESPISYQRNVPYQFSPELLVHLIIHNPELKCVLLSSVGLVTEFAGTNFFQQVCIYM